MSKYTEYFIHFFILFNLLVKNKQIRKKNMNFASINYNNYHNIDI